MFASRTNWCLKPNKISQLLAEMRADGAMIIDLSQSNPTGCKFRTLTPAILSPLSNPKNLCYEPNPHGLLDARRAVVNYYRTKHAHLIPDQIFLTASTSEAYSALFRLLLNPGERILVPRPSYPLFDFLADLNDIKIDTYRLDYDCGWSIDFDSIQHAITPTARAILIVHPNNPTGSFVKTRELKKLVSIAKKNSLAIIADEVFSDYAFSDDSERVETFAAVSDVLTFTLSGISKILAMPQMKLGWIAVTGPETKRLAANQRLEVILDTYLSTSTPIQQALPIWFRHGRKIQNELSERTQHNFKFLKHTLKENSPVDLLVAEGGWYATLRIPNVKTEEEWVIEFLKKDRVLVQPGYFFDFEQAAYLIISLIVPSQLFQKATARILKRIAHTA